MFNKGPPSIQKFNPSIILLSIIQFVLYDRPNQIFAISSTPSQTRKWNISLIKISKNFQIFKFQGQMNHGVYLVPSISVQIPRFGVGGFRGEDVDFFDAFRSVLVQCFARSKQ